MWCLIVKLFSTSSWWLDGAMPIDSARDVASAKLAGHSLRSDPPLGLTSVGQHGKAPAGRVSR